MPMTRVEPAAGVYAQSSDRDAIPAIPAARLLAMMDVAYGLQQFDLLPKNADAVAAVFEGAVEILAEVAANRIRRGLFRRHVEKPEDLQFIPDEPARGGWLAALFGQDPYLRCRYDGSLADFEDNEILLWSLFAASRAALRSPALAENARRDSRALAGSMPLSEANANAGVTRFYRRLGTHGRPIHGLCRLVLEHVGLRFADDGSELPLTVDEPALFRAYIPGLLAGLSRKDGVQQRYAVDYNAGGGRMYTASCRARGTAPGRGRVPRQARPWRPSRRTRRSAPPRPCLGSRRSRRSPSARGTPRSAASL